MNKIIKWVVIALCLLVIVGLAVLWFVVPPRLGAGMNATMNRPPYQASPEARELHKKLLVADLHADTLLWSRDLLEKSVWGHVDIPRLIEGNVAVQSFTVVTKTPRSMNIDKNAGDSDNITLLAFAERWPVSTWTSLTQRAIYQARRLHEAANRSQGKFVILKYRSDIGKYIQRRKNEQGLVAGFLGIEGAHALDGNVDNLDRLYDAGFRMIGIAHFFDNEMGGSAHGSDKGGLSVEGKELVRRMQEKKVFVDLAHASPKVIDDVLLMATRPVVVSHTGVKGTCENNRNLSDDQLKRIAVTGGVIGIGFWETATCGRDAKAIAKAMRHAVNVAGIDHIGLGSDYDGAVEEPFDTTGLVLITEALMQEGFSEQEIAKIMGGNVIRLLMEYLP